VTEDATAGQAVAAGPRLIHTGVYAVYESVGTPGGVHVTWRRTAGADDDGQVREIDGAPDEHMPDIPPEALPLIAQFMAHGIPPLIMGMLRGQSSPLGLLRQLGGLAEAEANGGPEGQAVNVGEHVHVPGDPACNGCGWRPEGGDGG
jgi:hypothetical protein